MEENGLVFIRTKRNTLAIIYQGYFHTRSGKDKTSQTRTEKDAVANFICGWRDTYPCRGRVRVDLSTQPRKLLQFWRHSHDPDEDRCTLQTLRDNMNTIEVLCPDKSPTTIYKEQLEEARALGREHLFPPPGASSSLRRRRLEHKKSLKRLHCTHYENLGCLCKEASSFSEGSSMPIAGSVILQRPIWALLRTGIMINTMDCLDPSSERVTMIEMKDASMRELLQLLSSIWREAGPDFNITQLTSNVYFQSQRSATCLPLTFEEDWVDVAIPLHKMVAAGTGTECLFVDVYAAALGADQNSGRFQLSMERWCHSDMVRIMKMLRGSQKLRGPARKSDVSFTTEDIYNNTLIALATEFGQLFLDCRIGKLLVLSYQQSSRYVRHIALSHAERVVPTCKLTASSCQVDVDYTSCGSSRPTNPNYTYASEYRPNEQRGSRLSISDLLDRALEVDTYPGAEEYHNYQVIEKPTHLVMQSPELINPRPKYVTVEQLKGEMELFRRGNTDPTETARYLGQIAHHKITNNPDESCKQQPAPYRLIGVYCNCCGAWVKASQLPEGYGSLESPTRQPSLTELLFFDTLSQEFKDAIYTADLRDALADISDGYRPTLETIAGDDAAPMVPGHFHDIPFVYELIEAEPEDSSSAIVAEINVVEVKDPAQTDKVLCTAVIARIDRAIELLLKVFCGSGMEAVNEKWLGAAKEPSPRFPFLPGVLKADHINAAMDTLARPEKEELYLALRSAHHHALQCISADAWVEVAKRLGHPVYLGDGVAEHATWIYYDEYRLTLKTRMKLSLPEWIDDDVINTAQSILRRVTIIHFAGVHYSKRLATANNRQVQLLFVNGNHWVTLSNIHEVNPNDVTIYDTMPPHHSSAVFKIQVASVFRVNADDVNLNWPPMVHQPNSNDCAAFAIAASVAVAFGDRPENMNFDPEMIRSHLLACLQRKTFDRFPTRATRETEGRSSGMVLSRIIPVKGSGEHSRLSNYSPQHDQARYPSFSDRASPAVSVSRTSDLTTPPAVRNAEGDSVSSWSFSASFNSVNLPRETSVSSTKYFASDAVSPRRSQTAASPGPVTITKSGTEVKPDDQVWFEYGCV
ncbi:hypothetical protein BV898_02092 [Hypsibius exemplaris]|uniref:Ubiquitin-like protease family profile domain-containing protein n=1 Tax=Hypsibius exemplaris TaxID=2072580 RepID=A0A1W0XA03_HYPEX|nr:hypothetical protein BV898_02092 [Hypsibius exemplaris]